MKRIIFTTVGTSIFQNYLKKYHSSLKFYDENIKNKEITENLSENIYEFKKRILTFCKENYPAHISDTSAEIQSLYQMKKEGIINPSEEKLVLLHSDTLDGKIAAEIIKDFFSQLTKNDSFKFKEIILQIMENIRGDKAEYFRNGLEFLTDNIKSLAKNFKNVVINFTGGYKGVIPALTILYRNLSSYGKNCILCYLFEETDKIIKFRINNGEIDIDDNQVTSNIRNNM